ncbi:MAG: hypothetical protein FJ148_26450 [Deltaproteobacteria bacterium]|nr:hypothetical protein [Deltaproteobacteria bacterium]
MPTAQESSVAPSPTSRCGRRRQRVAVAAALLLAGALAVASAHAADHRLDASEGCAVCRHLRATPAVAADAIVIAPLALLWWAPPPVLSVTRSPHAQSARARSPPAVAPAT